MNSLKESDMNRTSIRARVAIGAAVVAAATIAAAGPIAATTEPPTSDPTTSNPASSGPDEPVAAGSAPLLDPEREALVEQIMSVTEAEDFPLNRDCLAGIVAQLADADLPLVSAEVATPAETAISVTLPPVDAVPAATAAPATDAPDDMVPESSASLDSTPAMSPEAEALGDQIIYCLEGDADPDLVEEVMALIEADETVPAMDMRCVASALTTFDNETLQFIIDNGFESVSDPATPDASMPDDDAIEDAFLLLACTDGIADGVSAAVPEAAPAGTATAASDTTEA